MEIYLERPRGLYLELLKYENYEQYLHSFILEQDYQYLADQSACQKLVEYGYRSAKLNSEEVFCALRKKAQNYCVSKIGVVNVSGAMKGGGDAAQEALAIRERANRIGILATIIYMNYMKNNGEEISGYIDYAHSLRIKNWNPFFYDKIPMRPTKKDLGFYDWKRGKAVVNDSMYYKAIMDPEKGLIFQNKFDRIKVIVDPYESDHGCCTTSKRFNSKLYKIFVLFDHVSRSMI